MIDNDDDNDDYDDYDPVLFVVCFVSVSVKFSSALMM